MASVGLLALVLLAGLAFWLRSTSRAQLSAIPLADSARLISEEFSLLGLRREVVLSITEEYPSHSVRDFYAQWAERSGWRLTPQVQDPWSTDRWESFVDTSKGEDVRVDQWLVRWTSPDKRWDVRLALKYERPRRSLDRPSEQAVFVVASRVGL